MLGGVVIFIIVGLLVLECARYGWKGAFISSFWVFTLFYILSYPVKYLFIVVYNIEYVAPVKPDSESLFLALLLSFMFWLSVYIFRRRPHHMVNISTLHKKGDEQAGWGLWLRPDKLILLGLIGVSLLYFYQLLEAGGGAFFPAYEGNAQNEARVGSGALFLLYTLYLKAFFASLFMIRKRPPLFIFVISCLVIVIGFSEMLLLGTRRPLFLMLYAFIVWLVINKKSPISVTILAFFPLVMSLLAPIGQIIRYSFVNLVVENVAPDINLDYILVSIGSTFEGIEHLANYLSKLSVAQVLFGVDQGMAWLFNSGLSLIPRAVWDSKPMLYGSVAEQYYLYPRMYDAGAGQTTLPPGIIVDAMYGFGIFFMFVLAYFYAKTFSVMDKSLFVRPVKPGFELLATAVVYIHMFNLVRGGTAIIMMIVMLQIIAFALYFLERIKLGIRL